MTSRASIDAGVDRIFDDTQNYETTLSYAPLQFLEDFIGAGHTNGIPASTSPATGYPWVKKIVGVAPPTAGLVANAAGGQIALALAATSEAEEATVYWNDALAIDGTKRANIEFRAALSVTPSAAGVQAVFGLAQAWASGPDNNAHLLQFGFTANNGLLLRMKDTAGLVSQAAAFVATPSTQVSVDTAFHIFRIDMSDATDVGFWFDGARVNPRGSFNFQSTGANAIFQPYCSVFKPSGTGLATLAVDKIDIWSARI